MKFKQRHQKNEGEHRETAHQKEEIGHARIVPVVFGKHSAKHNSAFIMRAARETDNYKFRVILSRKVTGGIKSCKQYKGQLRLVTKTVG